MGRGKSPPPLKERLRDDRDNQSVTDIRCPVGQIPTWEESVPGKPHRMSFVLIKIPCFLLLSARAFSCKRMESNEDYFFWRLSSYSHDLWSDCGIPCGILPLHHMSPLRWRSGIAFPSVPNRMPFFSAPRPKVASRLRGWQGVQPGYSGFNPMQPSRYPRAKA